MITFADRPVTTALSGMVTCPHALASQAGVDVLKAGGSAVDAAIAASSTLAVIYPHMTGLGGDAFWLIYDAEGPNPSDRVRYLDGGGRAAASASVQWFHEHGHTSEIPFRGVLPATLTTPGAVASWVAAHKAYGRLPLKRDLEAATTCAREGFEVTARLARWIEATAPELAPHAEKRGDLACHEAGPRAPAARSPTPTSRARWMRWPMAATPASTPATWRTRWRASARSTAASSPPPTWPHKPRAGASRCKGSYRGVTIYETPAPTQGFTVLEMLNLLEPLELHRKARLGPDHVHLMVQAKQIAYHDRDRHLADPLFADVPTQQLIERLISKAYADERRALIDPARALPWDRVPSHGSLRGDTVFIAAVDAKATPPR